MHAAMKMPHKIGIVPSRRSSCGIPRWTRANERAAEIIPTGTLAASR